MEKLNLTQLCFS